MADTIDFDAVRENLRREADAAPHYRPPRNKALLNARVLQEMEFPPIKYVVPGYLAEGLTILAGKPKLGKSWLVLDWAIGVAAGTHVMEDQPVEGGSVLYAALEDNPRRLQRRMQTLLPNQQEFYPDRLDFTCEMPRLDDGGLAFVREWIEGADNPRMVIIDTLAKVRASRSDKDTQYEGDYKCMQELHALAAEHGVAIILVHHTRKMAADDPLDSVSGTLGLTGAADSTLVLDRNVNGTVTLYGRGRDVEEIETALQFDKLECRWKVLGDADQVSRSEQRNKIIQALGDEPEPVTPTELAAVVDSSGPNVKKLLRFMLKDGEVAKFGRGRYHLPGFDGGTDEDSNAGSHGSLGSQRGGSVDNQGLTEHEKGTGGEPGGSFQSGGAAKGTGGNDGGSLSEDHNSLKEKETPTPGTKGTKGTGDSGSQQHDWHAWGQKVRDARKAKGMTQKSLAAQIAPTADSRRFWRQILSDVECKGHGAKLTADTVKALEQVLGMEGKTDEE